MTLPEFKAWLDGYTLAGGTDVTVVKAKLAEVWDFTVYPTIPTIQPTPYVPWYPWVGSPTVTWSGTSNGVDDLKIYA